MSERKVLAGKGGDRKRLEDRSPSPGQAWLIVGGLGLALGFVGSLDLVLLFFPPRFGNAEWEFASISAGLNGLPVLALGLGLVVAAGVARGNRSVVRVGAVVFGVLGVVIIGLAAVYLLTVPIALGSTSDPVTLLTIKKSIAKTVGQVLVYPTMFLAMAVFVWRVR